MRLLQRIRGRRALIASGFATSSACCRRCPHLATNQAVVSAADCETDGRASKPTSAKPAERTQSSKTKTHACESAGTEIYEATRARFRRKDKDIRVVGGRAGRSARPRSPSLPLVHPLHRWPISSVAHLSKPTIPSSSPLEPTPHTQPDATQTKKWEERKRWATRV